MSRPRKVYDYYRYGTVRATGTIRALSEQLSMSRTKLQGLARIGRSERFTGDAPEYLIFSHDIRVQYALYYREEIRAEGNIYEIAEKIGVKPQTVRWYGSPTGQKSGNHALVRIDEEEII